MKITDAMVEAARAEFHRPPCGNQRTPCCEDKSHVHWFVNEYDRMKRADSLPPSPPPRRLRQRGSDASPDSQWEH